MAELINMPRAAWKRQPSCKSKIASSFLGKEPRLLVNIAQGPIDIITGFVATLASQNLKTYPEGIGFFSAASTTLDFFDIPFGGTSPITCVVCTGYEFRSDFVLRQSSEIIIRHTPTNTSEFILNSFSTNDRSPTTITNINNRIVTVGSYGASGKLRTVSNGAYSEVTPTGSYANSSSIVQLTGIPTGIFMAAIFASEFTLYESLDITRNPWQLFAPDPPRFFLIPSSGLSPTSQISIDALIQRAGLTQTTSLDALLQSAFSRPLSIDGLIAATQAGTISLDALLQIVGTHTISVDALLQATKTGAVSVDALLQVTLSQALSLDALIQAIQTAELSLDALLSKPMTVASVMDALIQASKTGAVSLDAILTGASTTAAVVSLDALIQAIQTKTLSVDALLQKTYTTTLALDAYVALTQIKTVSLDALLQAAKTGVISLDAMIQMTRTATLSFDALVQAAKTGVISLDAILVFATQSSLLLDAYVQKTLSAGVGLDAIIGAIADMILPTGRVITVPASDRFVFVTHSDRVIQIQ